MRRRRKGEKEGREGREGRERKREETLLQPSLNSGERMASVLKSFTWRDMKY